ncbi:MAG TPA: DUF2065 domain-containing protein [Gammaproteobacteria bacterium]|nr:DUF2065 domain-containing protein [Gammaproteobacteria bacterium]
MATDLLSAFALMLVLEGLLPFASPDLLRRVLLQAVQLNDRGLRLSGLASMLVGVALLYLARY